MSKRQAVANHALRTIIWKTGQERGKAFSQLVRRTGIEDILSQALKVYATALRTRRRPRAEAALGKADSKMLFPVIQLILPALFVVTLVPGVLSVLRDLRTGIGPR